jgi:hypothetical protein
MPITIVQGRSALNGRRCRQSRCLVELPLWPIVRTLYLEEAHCSSLLVCHRVYLGPLSASLRPLSEHPIILLLGIDSAESQTLMLVPHGDKHVTVVCHALSQLATTNNLATCFLPGLASRCADGFSQSLDLGRFLASVIELSGLPRQISGTTELNMHTIHADAEPSSTSGCQSLGAEPAMSQLTTATGAQMSAPMHKANACVFSASLSSILSPGSSEIVLYDPRSYQGGSSQPVLSRHYSVTWLSIEQIAAQVREHEEICLLLDFQLRLDDSLTATPPSAQ